MSVNDNGIVNKSNNYLSQLARRLRAAENLCDAYVQTVAKRLVLAPRRFIGEQTPDGRIINLQPCPEPRDALTEAEEFGLSFFKSRVARARWALLDARRKIALDEQARAVHIHDHERRTLQRGGLDAGGTDGSV